MEKPKDPKTEDKIMSAAVRIFTEKGYAAARIRDIAENAGVNLALVNYYYKSKENLFAIIMRYKVRQLFGCIIPHITDEKTSLEEKIDLVSAEFCKVIASETTLPLFVFNELQKQDSKFIEIIPSEDIKNSVLLRQIAERRPDINPLQFVLNILGLAFFPYIVSPVMVKAGLGGQKEFSAMFQERMKLIPQWMKQMLEPGL